MVVPAITNTHPVQTHIIIDRYNVPHKIRAGQTIRNVEMIVSEVDTFRKLRAPGRFTPTGLPLPQHPLVFDVPQIQQPLDGGEGERRAEARALKGKAA